MIEFKKFDNGFEYIEVKNKISSAKISLQGAHLFSFKIDENELLWVSEASNFKYKESIRGGIPICWPSFGMSKTNPNLPQHGFARTSMWELTDSEDKDEVTTLNFKLKQTNKNLKLFNYKFELTYTIIISKDLTLQLNTKNNDNKAFKITQALHTYFDISNILDIKISGLDKKPYLDALDKKQKIQIDDLLIDKEVDRVFQEINNTITLHDKTKTIDINNQGSSSLVVWNPWYEKCSKMSAMNNDSFKTMVCIESANAFEDEVEIQANKSHTLEAKITLSK